MWWMLLKSNMRDNKGDISVKAIVIIIIAIAILVLLLYMAATKGKGMFTVWEKGPFS
ncbi:MAG: hypothetical protein KAT43_01880 [Nanoarchaeota archaeon]|nr:hypothetical protein [Nanoarchaeota archaeon]